MRLSGGLFRQHLWISILIVVALLMGACTQASSVAPTVTAFVQPAQSSTLDVSASPLAGLAPTFTAPRETETPNSLEEYLAGHGLQLWQDPSSAASSHPIEEDIFRNPQLYAPFWQAFEAAFNPAQELAALLTANGIPVLLEVRWNGISSAAQQARVDVFVRDGRDPGSVIWSGSEDELVRNDIGDPDRVAAMLPAQLPVDWEEPARFVYLDDPFDGYSEGMHVVDAAGEVMAFWDAEAARAVVVQPGENGRAKVVNGFDVPLIGFDKSELEALWEAFFWIRAVVPDAEARFQEVDAIRRSALDRYQAGAAQQSDILLSSDSFTLYQEMYGFERMVDIVAVAGYLMHEVTHVLQNPVCTEAYAESLGMTLEEYALFLETGPGQAYETEAAFLQAILELENAQGYLLGDPAVRDIIEQIEAAKAYVVGRDHFPGGELVPTCADFATGSMP